MSGRMKLPDRRPALTYSLRWQGIRYDVSIGTFADGRPAEAFISGPKSGADVQAIGRDAAILLSLALQHGVGLDLIARAVTRDEAGRAQSIVGAVVDAFAEATT